jgi:HSP20 family protein
MATQRTWDPLSEMLSLRDAMGQLLESSFVRPGTGYGGPSQAGYSFPINVHGTADVLKVEALLPGVSQEDVNVDLDRGVLTISAKRHGPEVGQGEQWHLREFNPGQFARSLSLPFPVEIDQVGATFTNGVLTLTLPKAEAAKPRRIQIGQGQRTEQLSATNQQ